MERLCMMEESTITWWSTAWLEVRFPDRKGLSISLPDHEVNKLDALAREINSTVVDLIYEAVQVVFKKHRKKLIQIAAEKVDSFKVEGYALIYDEPNADGDVVDMGAFKNCDLNDMGVLDHIVETIEAREYSNEPDEFDDFPVFKKF